MCKIFNTKKKYYTLTEISIKMNHKEFPFRGTHFNDVDILSKRSLNILGQVMKNWLHTIFNVKKATD